MSPQASPADLAGRARQLYLETLLRGVPGVVDAVVRGANGLAKQKADPATAYKRQNLALDLVRPAPVWERALAEALRAEPNAPLVLRTMDSVADALATAPGEDADFDLVGDAAIDTQILASRLALSLNDVAAWELSDLSARVCFLEDEDELGPADMLRPHVVACAAVKSWVDSGLPVGHWRELNGFIHAAFGELLEEAYHETNRWLLGEGVLPEIDLRPQIRRTVGGATPTPGVDFAASQSFAAKGGGDGGSPAAAPGGVGGKGGAGPGAGADEDTPRARGEAAIGRLRQLVAVQVPQFAATAPASTPQTLRAAISEAQEGLRASAATQVADAEVAPSMPALLQELQQRKRALKAATSSPAQRATIEIVALLFQSILTEDKIPAGMRVWFARLQMPVLRVAISEPDFFATTDHPARRLIDRMGACVMGFDVSSRTVGDALDKEIKRIVQVVEAYPDTGRRVFQTVLNEFERFLQNYFEKENEATRKGVSLAQQVEQRETLAIQYTIELRKMLEGMPVQEGVRNFLFHAWADVLATTALKAGPTGEATGRMKAAAGELIWSASAKVSREERAEVIRRLPPLLKTLRAGMTEAGLPSERQEEQIKILNDALAAAFTARSAAIPAQRLGDLTGRLADLEEVLPDADEMEIDESLVVDLSGHESTELQVVSDGGATPTLAVMGWARELQVGSWYMMEHRGVIEPVQLAWQGMRKQLSLFVSQGGRGTLFQQKRLAAYLQAGLLVPAQEESLTVRATRNALARLDADPSRLLN